MASTTPTILVPTPVVLHPGKPRLGIWPQLFLPALGGWTFGETVLSRTVTNDPVWLVWINFRHPDGSVRPVYQFPVPLPPSPPPNNTTTQASASTPGFTTNTAMASVHAGRPSSSGSRMAPPPPPSGSRLAPRAPASSSAVGHAPAPASRGRIATVPRTQPGTAAARTPVPRPPSGSRPIFSSRRPSTPVASTSGSRVPTATPTTPTTPPRRKIAPLPRSKKEVPSTQRSGERVPPLSPSGNTMAGRVTSSSKSPMGASSTHATVGEAENVPPSEPTTAYSSSPTRKRKEARDVESAMRPQLNHEDFNWYETGCLMLSGDLPVDYALFNGKLLDAQVEEFERDFIDYEAGDETRAEQLAALQ